VISFKKVFCEAIRAVTILIYSTQNQKLLEASSSQKEFEIFST